MQILLSYESLKQKMKSVDPIQTTFLREPELDGSGTIDGTQRGCLVDQVAKSCAST
jgi:hypothetical protein